VKFAHKVEEFARKMVKFARKLGNRHFCKVKPPVKAINREVISFSGISKEKTIGRNPAQPDILAK